jgi:hypothetical protein
MPGTFPDGTSNTIVFAEKYATGARNATTGFPRNTTEPVFGALWANNDNPGDCFSPAFAVTYDNGGTYTMYAAAPAMFQTRPLPIKNKLPAPPVGADVNLASTPHSTMQVLMGDGTVKSLTGDVDPTGVWWPLLTPASADQIGPH